MKPSRIYTWIVLFSLLLTACGGPRPPRGDFVLILAQTPPTTPSPHFEQLASSALVFEGDLQGPLDHATINGILAEVLTGQRVGQEGGALYETRPVLPMSARLAGYRVLGSSAHASAIAEMGLGDGFDYHLFGGSEIDEETGVESVQSVSEGATEALQLLSADYKALGVNRAPVLFFGDLSGASQPSELEDLLDALSPELLAGVAPGASTPTTVVILFLAPDSPTRAILAGRDIPAARKQGGVDPRDMFPTIARKGGIPATALLQGVLVPSYLAGRDLLSTK